jgi:hypothetical protein
MGFRCAFGTENMGGNWLVHGTSSDANSRLWESAYRSTSLSFLKAGNVV